VAGAQYGATALITATVPKLLGVPVTPVYFGTLVVVAVLNFLIFRRIFAPSAQTVELYRRS
jgi:hypothetical protein